MRKLKLVFVAVLAVVLTQSVLATTPPSNDPALVSVKMENAARLHAEKLKDAGITLEELKMKYGASASSDPCLEAAWAYGDMFSNEYDAWAATDWFYEEICIRAGGLERWLEEEAI